MNVARIAALVSVCFLAGAAAESPRQDCAEEIAARLLDAIVARNASRLAEIANNPPLLDAEANAQLLSDDPAFRFSGDRRSAHSLLHGKEVLTKVEVQDREGGTQLIDIVFLPVGAIRSFPELEDAPDAEAFKDFVACQVELDSTGRTKMVHACFLETDVL